MWQHIVLPVVCFASLHPTVQIRFLEFRWLASHCTIIPISFLCFYFLIFLSRSLLQSFFEFQSLVVASRGDAMFFQFPRCRSISPSSYPCVVSLLSNSFVLSFSWTHSESRCKFYSALLGANSIFRRLAMTPIFFLGIKHPVLFLLSLMIVLALKRLRGSIFYSPCVDVASRQVLLFIIPCFSLTVLPRIYLNDIVFVA